MFDPIWVTRDGRQMKIEDMEDDHIKERHLHDHGTQELAAGLLGTSAP